MHKVPPSQMRQQELEAFLRGEPLPREESPLSGFIRLTVQAELQRLLEAEQDEVLGRARYERGSQGVYRNGYEPGLVKTAEGVFQVDKPQVRGLETPWRSQLFERLRGISGALQELVVQMYTHGMSTRDIEQALEQALGGFVLSKSTVSVVSEELTRAYEAFKSRSLEGFDVAYVFLDTVYEPLRRYGCKTGVLCAWAYLTDGARVLLDLTTVNAEDTQGCVAFLRGMVKRGLRVPLTVTTDGAQGLIAAVETVWPQSWRIRCWVHKMQNLMAKVPPPAWPEFKALVVAMRDAPTLEDAQRRREALLAQYREEFPEACRCLLEDAEASLNHLHVPPRHRSYVRTTNLIERAFEEQRRRTKVIPHLIDEGALLKLVFGVLSQVSERWSRPLFSAFEREQIIQLRNQRLQENCPVTPQQPRSKRRRATPAA